MLANLSRSRSSGASAHPNLKRQRGQVLLECLLALVLLLMASVWASAQWQSRVDQTRIHAMAMWLLSVRDAIGQDADFLRANDPSLTSVVTRLKQLGRLPAGFGVQPPLPMRLSLVAVSPPCSAQVCRQEGLLVAEPSAGVDASLAHQQAMDLLLALEGKGAIVLSGAAQSLHGPTIHYTNPLPGGRNLPIGSVALSIWRSDHLPPYVRLQEDRAVRFSGDVQFEGNVSVHRPLLAQAGVVIGSAAGEGATCAPPGLISTFADGGLALCQGGFWARQAVSMRPRTFEACMPSGDGIATARTNLPLYLPGIGGSDENTRCGCAAGSVPRFLGLSFRQFQGLPVYEGFVCES